MSTNANQNANANDNTLNMSRNDTDLADAGEESVFDELAFLCSGQFKGTYFEKILTLFFHIFIIKISTIIKLKF